MYLIWECRKKQIRQAVSHNVYIIHFPSYGGPPTRKCYCGATFIYDKEHYCWLTARMYPEFAWFVGTETSRQLEGTRLDQMNLKTHNCHCSVLYVNIKSFLKRYTVCSPFIFTPDLYYYLNKHRATLYNFLCDSFKHPPDYDYEPLAYETALISVHISVCL